MIHYKGPVAAELVPQRESRPDRAAGISYLRLDVDPPVRPFSSTLASSELKVSSRSTRPGATQSAMCNGETPEPLKYFANQTGGVRRGATDRSPSDMGTPPSVAECREARTNSLRNSWITADERFFCGAGNRHSALPILLERLHSGALDRLSFRG